MEKGFIDAGVILSDKERYQKWIDENVLDVCRGHCLDIAKRMVEFFPELRVVGVSGLYEDHAWCVTSQGNIVDPTAHQFSLGFDYPDIFLELEDFPKGKCPWCGELIWPDTERARYYAFDEVGDHPLCREKLREVVSGCK